jgi:hypothetical protein
MITATASVGNDHFTNLDMILSPAGKRAIPAGRRPRGGHTCSSRRRTGEWLQHIETGIKRVGHGDYFARGSLFEPRREKAENLGEAKRARVANHC